MNWRGPQDSDSQPTCRYLVDVVPGVMPHQAAIDGDALVRVGRPAWAWTLKERREEKKRSWYQILDTGIEEHRAAAIAMAVEALGKLRQ